MRPHKKCKLCSFETPWIADLRQHWQDEHREKYIQVASSIVDIDGKLKQVEQVAREGMIGYAERRDSVRKSIPVGRARVHRETRDAGS